jgi:hypothetical protein
MSKPQNVVELELLLQIYYLPDVTADQSKSREDAALRLRQAGLVEWNSHRAQFHITEMGTFYVKHLLGIPYPVAVTRFAIPEAA